MGTWNMDLCMRCQLCKTDFTCEKCEKDYCKNCSEVYRQYNTCGNSKCYYCSKQACWNVFVLKTYCQWCVPVSVLMKEEERKRIKEEEPLRHFILRRALREKGLELRSDSKLCRRYIQTGEGDIPFIVNRMCEMKFLFEYHDMRTVLQQVEEESEIQSISDYWFESTCFEEAEGRILKKTGGYPRVWPWIADKAARVIQNGCENWLWKPQCDDGTLGINLRIGLRRWAKMKEDNEQTAR